MAVAIGRLIRGQIPVTVHGDEAGYTNRIPARLARPWTTAAPGAGGPAMPCFGHGTDNAWDEAVQLVLSVADLPLDSMTACCHAAGPGCRPPGRKLLSARIPEQHAAPCLLLELAWFAGLGSFDRAIVPPLAHCRTDPQRVPALVQRPRRPRVLDLLRRWLYRARHAHLSTPGAGGPARYRPAALQLARDNAAGWAWPRVNIPQSDVFSALRWTALRPYSPAPPCG